MSLGNLSLIVCIIWISSEILLARLKHSSAKDSSLDKSSLRILWITIVLSISAGVALGFQSFGRIVFYSRAIFIAGLILIVVGLIIRWIAIISLRYQFTVDVSISDNQNLIQEGLYRFIRHPAYAGSLISFFGLGLCFPNYLSFAIIFFPILFAFLYRIRIEEKALYDRFGDRYAQYCKQTKKLIPKIY